MKRVLDVGNCGPDHGAITRMLSSHFDVEVVQAHSQADAMAQLGSGAFDLVMVNRLMDRDGSSGLEIIQQICSEDAASPPVMMITNFEQHQQAAETAGAVRGFGKNAIGEADTIELLRPYLS